MSLAPGEDRCRIGDKLCLTYDKQWDWCYSVIYDDGLTRWVCTRQKGHTGCHIACAYDGRDHHSDHNMHTWKNESEPAPQLAQPLVRKADL